MLTSSSATSPGRGGGGRSNSSAPRSCPPELRDLRERVAKPSGDLVPQGGGTPRQHLKLLALQRDREKAHGAPEHRVLVRQGPGAFGRGAHDPAPPLRKIRVPAPVSAHHGRDEVEGGGGRRSTSVIVTEPVAPDCLDEGGVGGAQVVPWKVRTAVGRVSDVCLEEGVAEREAKGANVRRCWSRESTFNGAERPEYNC